MNAIIKKIDESIECPICLNSMTFCFKTKVLNQYPAKFFHCQHCGYLKAHDPYWLDEAYTSAIATADTGLVARNIAIANKLVGVLYCVLNETGESHCLDAAGGYGMLTRIMRDFGFDFYWHDPYCTNILAPGFEYNASIGGCSVVTAMEVLEHVLDPVKFTEELFTFSGANSLVFTTELYEGEPPEPDAWWYYSFPTGQHIGFFQRRTLQVLSEKLGLNFASANSLHVLSKTPINERMLGSVTSRIGSRIAPFWIRKRMNSKMMSDHHLMLKKMDKDKKIDNENSL